MAPKPVAVTPEAKAKVYIESLYPEMLKKVQEDNYFLGPNLTKFIGQKVSDKHEMIFFKNEIISFCKDPKVAEVKKPLALVTINSSDPYVQYLLGSVGKRVVRESEDIVVGRKRERETDSTLGESVTEELGVSPGVFVVSDTDLEIFLSDIDLKLNELKTRRKAACAEMDRRLTAAYLIINNKIVEVLSAIE